MMNPVFVMLLLALFQQDPSAPQTPQVLVLAPSPTTQPLGQDLGDQAVIDGFIAQLETRTEYDASARKFVTESQDRLPEAEGKNFLAHSLAVLSPAFKEALDLVEQDQPARAAQAFETIAESPDPYLAVNAAALAAACLIEMEQLERCHRLITGVVKQHAPVTRYTLSPEYLQFVLGYCRVHLLEYEEGKAVLEDFLRRYPDAPERLRVTAAQIVTELSRRIPGSLGDVRDLLAAARRRLSQGELDDLLAERQNKAIALLEDLIKETEEQEKNQGNGGSSGGSGRNRPSGAQPGGGAKQSTLPGGPQRDPVLRSTRASPGDVWGRMPPREREEILQSMQKQFPGRYRELLEQYYKQLSKEPPRP